VGGCVGVVYVLQQQQQQQQQQQIRHLYRRQEREGQRRSDKSLEVFVQNLGFCATIILSVCLVVIDR